MRQKAPGSDEVSGLGERMASGAGDTEPKGVGVVHPRIDGRPGPFYSCAGFEFLSRTIVTRVVSHFRTGHSDLLSVDYGAMLKKKVVQPPSLPFAILRDLMPDRADRLGDTLPVWDSKTMQFYRTEGAVLDAWFNGSVHEVWEMLATRGYVPLNWLDSGEPRRFGKSAELAPRTYDECFLFAKHREGMLRAENLYMEAVSRFRVVGVDLPTTVGWMYGWGDWLTSGPEDIPWVLTGALDRKDFGTFRLTTARRLIQKVAALWPYRPFFFTSISFPDRFLSDLAVALAWEVAAHNRVPLERARALFKHEPEGRVRATPLTESVLNPFVPWLDLWFSDVAPRFSRGHAFLHLGVNIAESVRR